MKIAKALLKDNDIVHIICPKCDRIARIPLARLPGRFLSRVKCKCRHSFIIKIEHRNKFRRQVVLPGFYEISEQPKADFDTSATGKWESVQISRKTPNCKILNISRHGIAFEVLNAMKIKVGDIVNVEFTLDNSMQTRIIQACEVIHVNGRHVGTNMLSDNIKLGFYLLE